MELASVLKIIWPLLVLEAGLAAWALIDLARRPKTRFLPKAAWVVIALFVTTIGPILYLLLGREES